MDNNNYKSCGSCLFRRYSRREGLECTITDNLITDSQVACIDYLPEIEEEDAL